MCLQKESFRKKEGDLKRKVCARFTAAAFHVTDMSVSAVEKSAIAIAVMLCLIVKRRLSGSGAVDGTRTRDPLRDRQVF